MRVDNRDVIRRLIEDNLSESTDDGFYKFEAIIRKKDNPDNIFMKNHKGSFLVHSWLIKTLNDYDKYMDEMVSLCNLTGARLYMNLDKRSTEKTVIKLADDTQELLKHIIRKNLVSTKNTFNILNSITSRKEVSVHSTRKYLFDVDCRDVNVLACVINLVTDNNTAERNVTVLDSPNGWHVVVDRFDVSNIRELIENMGNVDIKDNAMTVVYFSNSSN